MAGYLKIYVLIVAGILIGYFATPLSNPLFPGDYSYIILDQQDELLRVFTNTQEQWIFPPYKEQKILRKLKLAVILYEDRYFYLHPGVDPLALIRALCLNLRHKKVVSGASTITMQCARLMNPKPRTISGKLLEILQALKIEILYSKKQILLNYLNHAPYGSNIVGYQAAAYKYFNKPPEQLTWSEAATLAVLPNAPSMINPVVNRGKLIEKRNQLLQLIKNKGHMDQATLDMAQKEPVPNRAYTFPFIAPQLGRKILSRAPNNYRVQTTIDKNIQLQAQEIVKRKVRNLQQAGIYNICVLVAKTQSGEVTAYLGSNDYFDIEHQGQIDGIQAPRSSGSILKPFLFALAMDDGLILPDTLIQDVPTHFKAFSPTNYNNEFNGLVNAKTALTHSLNVPAVRLLNIYGLHSFYLFLKSAGVSTLFRYADEYGLPLILGGAEVTMWDMVSLYRGLGRMGNFSKLRIMANESGPEEESLIHPGSVYLTLEMLRVLKRPGAEYYWEQYQNQTPLAWKTGTSYGHRDAWAIGVSPEWTIGVWAGNFSGEGNINLSGAKSAGPILFDIFNMLPKTDQANWFHKPAQAFKEAVTCLETGFIASVHCPHQKKVLVPNHQKIFRQCQFHQSYFITEDERFRVCSLCWQAKKYKKASRLIYPPHIMQFMREHGHQITKLPPHYPQCPSVQREKVIDMIYPDTRACLWLPRGIRGQYQKGVAQVTHRDPGCRIFWYLDENYIGETQDKHEKALALTSGHHVLEVIDDQGNQVKRQFQAAIRGE